MFLEEKRISSIKYIGKSRVINLNVKKNHNFITKNGIPNYNFCPADKVILEKIKKNN